MRLRIFLLRNAEAGELFELFFVSAVSAVLGIRFFLAITDYPQLGSETLHIAHMLWGGLFMLAALVLLFLFLNRSARFLAALLGGIGFGTFIDELGKFITKDNDYFYQPTIALIYVVFVLLFLLFRQLGDTSKLSKEEALANAFEIAKEGTIDQLSSTQAAAASEFIEQSGASDRLRVSLQSYVQEHISEASWRRNVYGSVTAFGRRWYLRLLSNKWFLRVVVAVVVFNAAAVFAQAAAYLPELTSWVFRGEKHISAVPLFAGAEILFSIISALLVLWGVLSLRASRMRAYQLFRSAILLSIFVTHFFIFFREELGAIMGFAGTVFVLLVLNYMIQQEKQSESALKERI